MSTLWISRLRKRLDDNRRYRTAMAEISTLTTRDLVDMRGSREEMHRYLFEEIYGHETGEVFRFNLGDGIRGVMANFRQKSREASSPSKTARSGGERKLALH